MAIVNCSPDSFSGDGLADRQQVEEAAERALSAGAHVLDVGAESTRPGAAPVDFAEEERRLLPAVRALRTRFPTAILSIDTTKPEIFRRAHALGAQWLNCVAGLPEPILQVAAATGAVLVITDPGGPLDNSPATVAARLAQAASRACAAGIAGERIILDPGFGFGKTPDENIALLAELAQFVALGYQTLLGVSRKSTLGRLLPAPPHERDYATSAASAMAARAGVAYVRVHNVFAAAQSLALADAVYAGWRPANWSRP